MQACLVIAYFFPPGGGVGVLRSLKFAKYLPREGWKPVVVSSREPSGIPRDPALLTEVPSEAVVLRVEPSVSLDRFLLPDRAPLDRATAALLLIPDPMCLWVRAATNCALRAIDAHAPRVIYTSSPPNSAHLVGLRLKRATGLPWVADFRDAWLSDPDRNSALHNRLRRATVERWMERRVVQHVDALITVSEPIERDFLARYPALRPEQVHVLPNGFDEEDYLGADSTPFGPFTFVFTGSLSKENRGPEPVLRAARLLIDRTGLSPTDVQWLFVGPFAPQQGELPSRYGLQEHARLVGPVSYRQALEYQCRADVNVLVYDGPRDGRSAQMMSTKVFEYLGARRPILAIAPPDAAASRLIAELGTGRTADPADVEAVAATMGAMLRQRGLPLAAGQWGRFSRRAQTGHLAAVFDQVVAASRP